MEVLIAGGGTGGHLYPGLALAKELVHRKEDLQITFVGTARGMEARVLPREGFPLALIRVEGLMGRGIIKGLGVITHLPLSLWDSFRILKKHQPALVIGVGGYASGPLMLAATILGKRRLILEQNVIPGMTNRLLAPWMHRVVVSFKESRMYFPKGKVAVLGNPVRRELLQGAEGNAGEKGKKTLLIFGGSRGARTLNRGMVEALDLFKKEGKDWGIIHQTGEADFLWVKQKYEEKGIRAQVEPFLFDMGAAYGQADLVVSRAGATTIAEITACGLPAILVPFPYATHDHQRKNAMVLEQAGAAVVMADQQLSGTGLGREIIRLMGDHPRLKQMGSMSRSLGHPQALTEIADLCFSMMQ
jgi:UDP-N-acetylglucosamine--N-acetylmuramyl-(pentapeptide) pyrophosphoryl-undecaprenol N-acetylglucosamine transferase